MEGAGNDFVVVDQRNLPFSIDELIELTPDLCDRHFGIGSDGILMLTEAERPEADYRMIFRNPDGSDAGMCGNGGRCMARLAHTLGFDSNHTFHVHDNLYQTTVRPNSVILDFPVTPRVNEHTVDEWPYLEVHTGTEHIVVQKSAEELEQLDELRHQGQTLRYHKQFAPKGTNVNFIQVTADGIVQLETYERGVEDLTLACGTGAIASALAAHHLSDAQGTLSSPIQVTPRGGALMVHFLYDADSQQYKNVKLEGPAHFVFKGTYSI